MTLHAESNDLMTNALSTNAPPADATLCVSCGYVLDGLPPDGRCPECGTPIEQTRAVVRSAPAWETVGGVGGFLRTTADVLLRPVRYWKTFASRPADPPQVRRAFWFGTCHAVLAGVLFATAVTLHARLIGLGGDTPLALPLLAFAVVVTVALLGKYLASNLTAFESRHRGMRLPQPVVYRVLGYQSAALLPFAVLAATTVGGAVLLAVTRPMLFAINLHVYIGLLAAEAVVGGAYLFWTYWMAMRGIMYANE